jgi:hypothetical protein
MSSQTLNRSEQTLATTPEVQSNPQQNIQQLKKDFEKLALALASKAVGSIHEPGASREAQNQNTIVDTRLDTKLMPGQKIALNFKNLVTSEGQSKDILALEMTSTSMYNVLKKSLNTFVGFFGADGKFDDTKRSELTLITTKINNLFNELINNSKTTLSADELKSCKVVLLSIFDIGQNSTLAEHSNYIDKGFYSQLTDKQYLDPAKDAKNRMEEYLSKFMLAAVCKTTTVLTSPWSGGASIPVLGVAEAGAREILERRTKDKNLERRVENWGMGLNEELALLDGVDPLNIADPKPEHTDQENQDYSQLPTNENYVKGYRNMAIDSLNLYIATLSNTNETAETKETRKKEMLRYSLMFLKSMNTIEKYLVEVKAALSAATFLSYNKNKQCKEELIKNLFRLNDQNLTTEELAEVNIDTLIKDIEDNLDVNNPKDKIALEVNPVERLRNREKAKLEKLTKDQKKEIRKGWFGRVTQGTIWCSIGNAFSVVAAGIGAMGNGLNGTQNVAVANGDKVLNSFGDTITTHNGQYMELGRHVAGKAQESFNNATGLEWLGKWVDGITGNENTFGAVYSEVTKKVIETFNRIPKFNDLFGDGGEAVGKVINGTRQFNFDGPIYGGTARLASTVVGGFTGLGVVAGSMIENINTKTAKLAVEQGYITPKLHENAPVTPAETEEQRRVREQQEAETQRQEQLEAQRLQQEREKERKDQTELNQQADDLLKLKLPLGKGGEEITFEQHIRDSYKKTPTTTDYRYGNFLADLGLDQNMLQTISQINEVKNYEGELTIKIPQNIVGQAVYDITFNKDKLTPEKLAIAKKVYDVLNSTNTETRNPDDGGDDKEEKLRQEERKEAEKLKQENEKLRKEYQDQLKRITNIGGRDRIVEKYLDDVINGENIPKQIEDEIRDKLGLKNINNNEFLQHISVYLDDGMRSEADSVAVQQIKKIADVLCGITETGNDAEAKELKVLRDEIGQLFNNKKITLSDGNTVSLNEAISNDRLWTKISDRLLSRKTLVKENYSYRNELKPEDIIQYKNDLLQINNNLGSQANKDTLETHKETVEKILNIVSAQFEPTKPDTTTATDEKLNDFADNEAKKVERVKNLTTQIDNLAKSLTKKTNNNETLASVSQKANDEVGKNPNKNLEDEQSYATFEELKNPKNGLDTDDVRESIKNELKNRGWNDVDLDGATQALLDGLDEQYWDEQGKQKAGEIKLIVGQQILEAIEKQNDEIQEKYEELLNTEINENQTLADFVKELSITNTQEKINRMIEFRNKTGIKEEKERVIKHILDKILDKKFPSSTLNEETITVLKTLVEFANQSQPDTKTVSVEEEEEEEDDDYTEGNFGDPLTINNNEKDPNATSYDVTLV